MAIKPIEQIPQKVEKLSQRELIRQDVREAISNNVAQFEFLGDAYKYDTLAMNVRETLKMMFAREFYFPATRRIKPRLESVIKRRFWFLNHWEYFPQVFTVSERKQSDRTHVYLTINLETLNNLDDILYADMIEEYKEQTV